MGLQGLKMQTNCLHVSPGDWTAEALTGPPEEEVVEGGAGDGLYQPPGLARGESSQSRRLLGRGQVTDQQRRRQHPYRVVKRFVRGLDPEGTAPDPANDCIQGTAGGGIRFP